MGLHGQRYEKISRSPRIFRAVPRLFFNFRTVGWFTVSYKRASGSLQACFPSSLQACSRFASSVFPRFASSVSGMSRQPRETSLSAIDITPWGDCGWIAPRLRLNRQSPWNIFLIQQGLERSHASHRRTVAPSHKAGSDMRRGNGRKWDYRVKIYYIIIYYNINNILYINKL